jgi:hypothetical protein
MVVEGTERFRWMKGGYFLVSEYRMSWGGSHPPDEGVMYWGYERDLGTFKTYFFNDQGPFDLQLSSYEGLAEQQQLTFTGPARFVLRLDDSGKIAVGCDGSIDTEWYLRDADGEWKPWRHHRYSPLATPGPDIKAGGSGLSTIAGHWTTSGSVIGDPPVPIAGTDNYDVLPGGHFLVHHVDVTVGAQVVRAIEIIGEPDPDTDGYLARSFDNHGNAEVMHLNIDDAGVFHFLGGADIAPAARPASAPTARVRSTLTIADDRRTMRALWQRSPDGNIWQPWMDLTFRRTDPLDAAVLSDDNPARPP